MANQTDICNIACALLGVNPINAITDTSKQAVTFNSIWNLTRQSELRKHLWKFSMLRANLTATASVPINGPYQAQFQPPANMLRLIQAGDTSFDYAGIDLSDYRSQPTQDDYVYEGGLILSNFGSPVSVRYVVDVPDWSLWDATFQAAFGALLAAMGCFAITNSLSLQKMAQAAYVQAIHDAVRANALETPPMYAADDSWILTRPVGSGGAPTIRIG